MLLLAAACATPLMPLLAGTRTWTPARALCVYLLSCALMLAFGAFSVPLLGMGMSLIIGFWLGKCA